MEAVPLLVGVIGSHDAANAAVRELGERCPHTPVVVRSADDENTTDRCDILVVVAHGGLTPELEAIVERRLNGRPVVPRYGRLLAVPDTGPCYVVDGPGVRRLFPRRFTDAARGAEEFAGELARRDRFNADLARVPSPEQPALEGLRARSDAAANRLQHAAYAWQLLLYALALVAATAQVITMIPHSAYVKFGAVILTFVAFVFVRRQAYQERYQDYRAIGEALRVQAIWSALGIDESVTESYLPMQQSDLQWIRDTLRTLAVLIPADPSAFDRDAVIAWVQEQLRYFTVRAGVEAHRRDAFGRGALVLGIVSLTLSLAALVMGTREGSAVLLVVGIVATWTALCVALVRSYVRARSYSENANRYQRMLVVFGRAAELLETAREPADVRAIATELGRDALTEHADWLLAQRERRIAIVQTAAV